MLRGSGGHKSSVSNVDDFDSMKEKTRFELCSTLSIAGLFAAKDLVKKTKETWLDVNPKREREDSILEEVTRVISP